MTQRNLILLTLVAVLGTACERNEPAAPVEPMPETTPAAVAEAHPVDATAVVDNTSAADTVGARLDSKALAGRFGDGQSILELRTDGSYVQTLQAGGGSVSTDGTWSASGDNALLLDPNSKSAQDARFVVVSNDELRTGDGVRTFHRVSDQ